MSPVLRRIVTIVRVLVALALVLLVASFIKFRDRHEPPGGTSRAGTIVSLESDTATFEYDDGTRVDVPPAEVRPGILRILSGLEHS